MKRALTALYLLLSLFSFGQNQDQNYIIDFISTKEGLSHNYVSSIVSDDLNMKWVGTENGITKFNGFDFEYIKPSETFQGLLNENIEVLFVDKEFNLWIGTKSGGLSYLDKRNNEVKNYNYLIDLEQEGDMRITALSQDAQGNIWVGTWADGVFVINVQTDRLIYHYNFNQAVYSISSDFYDNVWFCSGNRLTVFDPKTEELTLFITNGQVTDLLPDEQRNKLWIALSGNNEHLYSYDYSNQSIDSIQTFVPSNFSRKLSLDQYNRIWIGTWGKGVYRSNEDLSAFHKIELLSRGSERISSNYNVILDIHQDENNLIWLATSNGGLIKLLEGNNFKNADKLISNNDLLGNLNCNAIYKNADKLFVGTFNGLYVGQDFNTLTQLSEIGKVKINALYEYAGKLYIGTAYGFHIFDMETERLIFNSNTRIRKVTSFIVHDSNLYLGTQQQGVAIVNLQELDQEESYDWYSERLLDNRKLESNRITEIKKDQEGRIWVSSYNGLHLFNQNERTFTHQSELLEDNLPSVIINSMLLKDYRYALYDLSSDPGEVHDLSSTDTVTFNRLLNNLGAWEASMSDPLWEEEPSWMEVTYYIHKQLMDNEEVLYKSPYDKKKLSLK